MRTLYIDNSILNLEQHWPPIPALLRENPELRIVISDWHMVELASGSDRAQAFRRASFVDSLKPLWMHGSFPIQQQEVRRFTWENYYGAAAAGATSAFAEHLSEIWSEYVGPRTVIGLNATKWVAIVGDLSTVTSEKPRQIEVLRTLQEASKRKKAQIERQVFLGWVLARIDDRDPDGKLITRDEKAEIAEFCHEKEKEFYLSCPAMAVERALHKVRSRDPIRRPKGSDAIDLQHGILALSYCDYYVTRDRFARHCVIEAKSAVAGLRTAKIYDSLDSVAALLGSSAEGGS